MYFTYLFKWSSKNIKYYGVRYKDTATLESLCTTYFSSSKYVKKYIVENGLPDIIQVRRIFDNKISAKRWEEKVIRRTKAIKNDSWINKGNNNSFKDVVCNDEVRRSISLARKGQSFGKNYHNGTINKFFKDGENIPEGWIKGRLLSEKQKLHIENLNNNILTDIKRKQAGKKQSAKSKGVKKPAGHGANVSKATKGVPKPWQKGELNVSKREDVRKKISESWKTRVIGKWYTDGFNNVYIKPNETIPEGFFHGRTSNKKKYQV